MVKEAEGESARMISQARGQAQAIRNKAEADAKSVAEIARAVARHGENPTKYLLAMKYIEALDKILSLKSTNVDFMPMQTAFVQTAVSGGALRVPSVCVRASCAPCAPRSDGGTNHCAAAVACTGERVRSEHRLPQEGVSCMLYARERHGQMPHALISGARHDLAA